MKTTTPPCFRLRLPGGNLLAALVLLAGISSAVATVRYVDANGTHATPPYTNWAKAATDIQDAVAVSVAGDRIIVTNGVYPGTVNVTNPLALVSVNGPSVTVIDGGGTSPCAELTDGASLTGFTLANGCASWHGGGVYCNSTSAFLTNCIITGNRATGFEATQHGVTYHYPGDGGGVYGCTLYDCILNNNRASGGAWTSHTPFPPVVFSASMGGGVSRGTLFNCRLTGNGANYGGGAANCTFYNCTLTGNACWDSSLAQGTTIYHYYGHGGGAAGGALYNCIAYFNNATEGTNYDTSCVLNYCCTAPLSTNGVGNITNAPLFVDTNGWSNLRLQSNSPCINAGNNTYVTTATDLDGHQRIFRGTVDMGAYEFQGSGSLISYAWLQQYGWPTDGSADFTDPDHDGMNNWQEWCADTNPLDANDYLHITSFTRSGTYNTLWWASKSTRLYQVERRESLDAASPWETIITNAVPGWNNVAFDNLGPQYFYRIQTVRP